MTHHSTTNGAADPDPRAYGGGRRRTEAVRRGLERLRGQGQAGEGRVQPGRSQAPDDQAPRSGGRVQDPQGEALQGDGRVQAQERTGGRAVSITTKYCPTGRHFYPDKFVSCPVHTPKLTRYNVRIRTKFDNITKPDGSKTNDWTFQQDAENPKEAARVVVHSLFQDRFTAELFLRADPEVWVAGKYGISSKDIWRGTAS